MFFTQEDYRKIEKWLFANSRKDTEFAGASLPLKGNETVAFVQDGKNVNVFLKDLIEQIFLLGVSDFLNVTDKYGESRISLTQAIQLIPYKSRKIGQVITFLDKDGEWKLFQFQGERVNQWNNATLWVDLIKRIQGISIIDSEYITATVDNLNQTSLTFADKNYNTIDYSGLGRVYLRKNIQTVVNPNTRITYSTNLLTQQMLNKENTIYEIRYDFDLNGQEIIIPKGCVLDFQGGSLNNGLLNLNRCNVVNVSNEVIFDKINIIQPRTNSIVKVCWFKNIDISTINMLKSVCRVLSFEYVNIELTESIVIESTDEVKEIYGCKGSYTRNSRILTTITANSCDALVIKKAGTKIHNLCLVGNNCRGTYNEETLSYDNGYDGIRIEAYNTIIENMSIIEFAKGIHFFEGHVTSCNISKILIASCSNYGVYLIHENNGGNKNNNKFYDLYIVDGGLTPNINNANSTKINSGIGIYVKGGYENVFEGIVCERNSGVGIFIDSSQSCASRGNGFRNLYLEHNRYSNLLINSPSPHTFYGNSVKDIFSTYYSSVAPDKCRIPYGFIQAESAVNSYYMTVNNNIEWINPYDQLVKNTFMISNIDDWYNYILLGVNEDSTVQFEKHNEEIWQLFDNSNKNSIYSYLGRGNFDKGYWRIPFIFDRISMSADVTIKFKLIVGDNKVTYSDREYSFSVPKGEGLYQVVIDVKVPANTWVRFGSFRLGNVLVGTDKFYMKIKQPVKKSTFSTAETQTENFTSYFNDGERIFNQTLGEVCVFFRNEILDTYGFSAIPHRGTSEERPTYNLNRNRDIGFHYFDTTLGKMIYVKFIHPSTNEATWVDEKGFTPNISKGTLDEAKSLVTERKIKATDVGYEFFATDLKKSIYYGGDNKWVDATGTDI